MTATLFALYTYYNQQGFAQWTQQGVFQSKEHCERAVAELGLIKGYRCIDTGIPNGAKESKEKK